MNEPRFIPLPGYSEYPPHAGLVTLTHTPSPMKFLNEILGRPPDRERPFLLLVAGYPADDCRVPDIRRKSLAEVAKFVP